MHDGEHLARQCSMPQTQEVCTSAGEVICGNAASAAPAIGGPEQHLIGLGRAVLARSIANEKTKE